MEENELLKKIALFVCLLANFAHADEIHVGCASNFMATAEEIARLFEKSTPHKVKFVFGSSGKFSKAARETQEFEVLLLGDMSVSQDLENAGFVAKDSRFTYAIGRLVLWSKNPHLVDAKGEILLTGKFEHIIIPKIPENRYGTMAQMALENMKLWSSIEPKAIFAPTVQEGHGMIVAGKAELGFTALSLLNPQKKIEGSAWIVPQKFYTPIEQQVVLLKFAENNVAARAFVNFMKTPQARSIIEKYSYSVPEHKN